MTHQWIKFTPLNLPPQGKKIICFRKGDLWVCRRLHYKGKDYWLEIQYAGGSSMLTDTPDYWMELDLPDGCTGYMLLGINGGDPITFDELQRIDPESHEEFVEGMVKNAKRPKRNK
jgi:hypothetical protein